MSTDASSNTHSRRWSRLRDLFHSSRRRPSPQTINSSSSPPPRRSQNTSNIHLHITLDRSRTNSTSTPTSQTITNSTNSTNTPTTRRISNLSENPRHSIVRAYTRRSRRDRHPRRDRHSRGNEDTRVHSNPIPSSNTPTSLSRSSRRSSPFSLDINTGDHFDEVGRVLPLNTSSSRNSSNHRTTTINRHITNSRHPLNRPRASASNTSTLRPRSSTTSAITEIGSMPDHDYVAIVHGVVDYYPTPSVTSPDGYTSIPFHPLRSGGYRIAMSLRDAYNLAQNPNYPHHLPSDRDRELRWNFRPTAAEMINGSTRPGGRAPYECAASDDQIEALPSFVMEKGETRSVREIFASLRENKSDADNESNCEHTYDKTDECGGLMTSYTECAICLSEFEPGDEITALPCGHVFHLTGCVREWLRNHARTCPTCRADICATSPSSDGIGSHSGTVATSEELG